MEHINLNTESLLFLENAVADEISIALNSKEIFIDTYKFFGDIAAFNRMGILYSGGDNLNTFFDKLTPAMDLRLTVWLSNVVNDFIIHLNSINETAYIELKELLKDSLDITLSSDAFPVDICERVDIGLLEDPLYLTLFMLQPAAKRFIIENNKQIGDKLNETIAIPSNRT